MDPPPKKKETGYIIVMGMTGSGKTTFISRLTGLHAEVGIGHSLSSSTIQSTCYTVWDDKSQRELCLVDTPGFDDTTRSDTEILQTIGDQLASLHRARRPILGIVVLHRITDVRLAGSAVKTFNVLQRLCGPENYHRVVLATTMWKDASFNEANREAAMARQRRLRKYWEREDMFQGKSMVMRQSQDSEASAWRVVRAVSALADEELEYCPLQIQLELVEQNLPLEKTEAGRYVLKELLEAGQVQQRELAELEKKVEEGALVLRRKKVSSELSRSPDRVEGLHKWFASLWAGLRTGSWWKAQA